MNKKILFISAVVFLIINWLGCDIFVHKPKSSKKILTIDSIVVDRTIKLPLPNENVIGIENIQLINENKRSYYVVKFSLSSYLFIYDAQSQKLLKEIKPNLSCHEFKYINHDSIWIFSGMSRLYNFDTAIAVIDTSGKIKHSYPLYHKRIISFKTFPDLYTHEFYEKYKNIFYEKIADTALFPNNSAGANDGFVLDNKIFFLTSANNTSKKDPYDFPLIGYLDIKTNKVLLNDKIKMPYLHSNVVYPVMFNRLVGYTLSHDSNILVFMPYSSDFYKWNFKTNTIKLIHNNIAPKSVKDTIYPYKTSNRPETIPDSTSKYGVFQYLKSLNMYIRLFFPSKLHNTNKYLIILI